MRDFQPPGWMEEDCGNVTYTQYEAVDVKGVEVVQSMAMAYSMARSRILYFVPVDYADEGTYIPHISDN